MYMKKAKITLSLLLSAVLLVCALAPMSYASVAGANEAVKLAMTDAGADYEKYESDKFLPYMNEAKYKENLNENWEAGNYEVSFNWDDSLIVDTEREQTLQMQEVNANLRSKLKYIMFRYGMTEEQAKEELDRIQQEKMSNQEAFGFTPNNNNGEEE